MPAWSPLMLAVSSVPYLAAPLDPPADQPLLLDSDQFAALGIAAALVVALLAVIAVAVWRR